MAADPMVVPFPRSFAAFRRSLGGRRAMTSLLWPSHEQTDRHLLCKVPSLFLALVPHSFIGLWPLLQPYDRASSGCRTPYCYRVERHETPVLWHLLFTGGSACLFDRSGVAAKDLSTLTPQRGKNVLQCTQTGFSIVDKPTWIESQFFHATRMCSHFFHVIMCG